jgi:predicted acyltransferase
MGGGQIAAKFLGVRPQGERRISQLNLHCGLCGWMWSPARYPISLDQFEERIGLDV